MSLEDDGLLGDVINLSSSEDEAPQGQKRSRRASNGSHVAEGISHPHKRAKTRSSTRTGSSGSGASEEGEIDETRDQPDQPLALEVTMDNLQSNAKQKQSGAFIPPNGPVYNDKDATFALPVFSNKREGSWDVRFKDWVTVFCVQNATYGPLLTPTLVQSAYMHYLDMNSGLKTKKKRNAKQAAKQVEESGALESQVRSMNLPQQSRPPPKAGNSRNQQPPAAKETIDLVSESEEEYEPPVGTPLTAPSTLEPNGNPVASQQDLVGERTSDDTSHPVVAEEEMAMIRKYFPSASKSAIMCLRCGGAGHLSTNCSKAACKFCSSDAHWNFSCPTRARCGKCRQLGHGAADCQEKLALTKEEGLACSFCGADDHLEDECTEVWRSFSPDDSPIQVVQELQPSCGLCGDTLHYSSDCPDRRGSASNPTWSLKNRSRYVDSGCNSLTVEGEATRLANGPSVAQKSQVKIRGRAARGAAVHYSESDDSDVEFLGRRPPAKRGNVGAIRMASNIQMPRNAPAGASWQPPLPPGPPPSDPPPHLRSSYDARPPPGASSIDSLPARPPSSLPPRPPGRDYHRVPPPPPHQMPTSWNGDSGRPSNQSGSSRGGSRAGGRGSGGGRGRGRGRGGRGRNN